MRLLRLQVSHLRPFRDAAFSFCEEPQAVSPEAPASAPSLPARSVTVIHGPAGVGKTTLLAAIASTRPGSLGTLHQRRPRQLEPEASVELPLVVTDWALGQDDPERPHPLKLATPGGRASANDAEEALRRREQMVFDRVAREGGFVWLSLPGNRWFSRQPVSLNAPPRTNAGYELRSSSAIDDGSRADLARDTKQALVYATVSAALSRQREPRRASLELLGAAMHDVVDRLLGLCGFSYRGLDPICLEPEFESRGGAIRQFDELPTQARHLVAIGALSVRALWAAYPGRDPRVAEGVVAIDEVDLHQDALVQALLVPTLKEVLPAVQWIVTTTSGVIAGSADTAEVLALRRLPEFDEVEVFVGSDARTH